MSSFLKVPSTPNTSLSFFGLPARLLSSAIILASSKKYSAFSKNIFFCFSEAREQEKDKFWILCGPKAETTNNYQIASRYSAIRHHNLSVDIPLAQTDITYLNPKCVRVA